MNPVGILPVDKPEGPTSHDVVAIARRALSVRRVGHTGTLDPFASGLLLLCVGWATRLAEYLTALPKVYTGVIRLGERTDTDDRNGVVTARSDDWRGLTRSRLEEALTSRTGSLMQRPPEYSAKKVEGRRAYAVARAGGRPELEARPVRIHRLALLELSLPDVTVEIGCSSGTYVRAVARDLGEDLGVGGHLRALRRTGIGDFRVEEAVAIAPDTPAETLRAALRPPAAAVAHLPGVTVEAAAATALCSGQAIELPSAVEGEGTVAVFVEGGLCCVAERRDGRLHPRKVFPAAAER